MTKMTLKKTAFLFARTIGKRRQIVYRDVYLQYMSDMASSAFAYRAGHANRPTPPRKRYV